MTREWDGVAWLIRETDLAPAPRLGAAMAYDPNRKVSVMFADTVVDAGPFALMSSIPHSSRGFGHHG